MIEFWVRGVCVICVNKVTVAKYSACGLFSCFLVSAPSKSKKSLMLWGILLVASIRAKTKKGWLGYWLGWWGVISFELCDQRCDMWFWRIFRKFFPSPTQLKGGLVKTTATAPHFTPRPEHPIYNIKISYIVYSVPFLATSQWEKLLRIEQVPRVPSCPILPGAMLWNQSLKTDSISQLIMWQFLRKRTKKMIFFAS